MIYAEQVVVLVFLCAEVDDFTPDGVRIVDDQTIGWVLGWSSASPLHKEVSQNWQKLLPVGHNKLWRSLIGAWAWPMPRRIVAVAIDVLWKSSAPIFLHGVVKGLEGFLETFVVECWCVSSSVIQQRRFPSFGCFDRGFPYATIVGLDTLNNVRFCSRRCFLAIQC